MAKATRMRKPETQELLHLRVLRRERLSPAWMRVSVGEGDIARFVPRGYDQWFRLFLPVAGEAGLQRVPAKANTLLGYVRFLRIPEGERPVMRNYTVRAHRAAAGGGGAEIDIDFVLHGIEDEAGDGGSGHAPGPAAAWAANCEPGESVLLLDEGTAFDPDRGTRDVLLVGDETALPAIAGICESLPADATGTAIIEVPTPADAVPFGHPEGVEVRIVARSAAGEDAASRTPGALALDALRTHLDATFPGDVAPSPELHAFAAGEQALATGARRALVAAGVPKERVDFVGYWRA